MKTLHHLSTICSCLCVCCFASVTPAKLGCAQWVQLDLSLPQFDVSLPRSSNTRHRTLCAGIWGGACAHASRYAYRFRREPPQSCIVPTYHSSVPPAAGFSCICMCVNIKKGSRRITPPLHYSTPRDKDKVSKLQDEITWGGGGGYLTCLGREKLTRARSAGICADSEVDGFTVVFCLLINLHGCGQLLSTLPLTKKKVG